MGVEERGGLGCRGGMWVGKGEGCVWLDAIASSYLFRLVCGLLAFFFFLFFLLFSLPFLPPPATPHPSNPS